MVKKSVLIIVAVAVAVVCALSAITPARAAINTQTVVYTIDNQPFEGYIASNSAAAANQPVVMIVHDWNGLDEYEQRRAQMLAEQGYTAFAVDLYGQGVRPSNPEASRMESGKLYADRQTMRQRLQAGLAQTRELTGVDNNQVVAIGYSFGGAAVLELARSGADIDGYVTFHGGLATPDGQDYSQTQGRLLVLHGADDPVAPMTQVAQLADELTQAGVTFNLEIYGGARHAFTVWDADRDSSRYNLQADRKSWQALMAFLADR